MQNDGTEFDGFGAGPEDKKSFHWQSFFWQGCHRQLIARIRVRNVASTMTEGDPAFGQIVGGKFERDFIASENSNSIAAQTAGQMGEDDSLMFQLHAEQTAGKFLQYGTSYFYAVFLTHSTSRG
jgi:hypothetical protein